MNLSIEKIEVLLLVAAMVAMLARRLQLPYTVGLVFAGIGMALIGSGTVQLTREMIFKLFLPPLIFEAALYISWRELRRNFPVILLMVTLGVVLSWGITGWGMHFVAHWEWSSALLFGALIAATDPVSVLALFKELNIGGQLKFLLETESLFNDATAVIIFTLVMAAVNGQGVTTGGISRLLAAMLLGGVACGVLVGGVTMLLAGRTEDHLIEITFTVVAAYGSFLLAEHFHFSGILATLSAGIIIGNLGCKKFISEKGREALGSFWEYLAFVVNSLIFLFIGAHLARQNFSHVFVPALVAVLFVLLGRAAAVYISCAFFARSHLRVRYRYQHLLFWGGLRGALALAMALSLPLNIPRREMIITIAFILVAFSVIVQNLTIMPLIKKFGIESPDDRPYPPTKRSCLQK